jgi:hypothetical protein
MTTYRPRLSVEISPAQQKILQQWLDHGMQKRLFNIIIDDVIAMLNEHGREFLAAVMLKKVNYADYSTLEIRDGDNKRSAH